MTNQFILRQMEAKFNGTLKDYLESMLESDSLYQALSPLKGDDLQVLVDYPFSIHHDLISNQIIRYKDIQKVPDQSFTVPFLLYGKNAHGLEFAFILTLKETDYLWAKGLYLALTEPGSALETLKNTCIASTLEHPGNHKALQDLIAAELSAGSIQRSLDKAVYTNHDQLIDLAHQKALSLQDELKEQIPTVQEKGRVIAQAVIQWFLLKKMVYVHTMMNRNLLNGPCKGDVKQQRHLAKQHADSIQFMMYSEMWRL